MNNVSWHFYRNKIDEGASRYNSTLTMLTRHLYEADEVSSAIGWCMKKGHVEQLSFWIQELIDSEMVDELYTALYSGCIWVFGIGRLEGLRLVYNLFHREGDLSADDIITVVYNIALSKQYSRDASVFALLAFGGSDTEQPDRASANIPLIQHFETKGFVLNNLESEFIRACWQRKTRLAWDLSRALWQEDVERTWKLIHTFQEHKYNMNKLKECLEILEKGECVSDWAQRACAVAAICMDKNDVEGSLKEMTRTLDSDILKAQAKWAALEGRRKRRIYQIPRDCLYWITRRGRSTNLKKNLEKVYCGSFNDLRGCPFWDRVIQEEDPCLNDDNLENFYSKYFPEDIPDEWSLEDQEKSHGYGALIGSEKPNFRKYANRWYCYVESGAVWLGTKEALPLLSKISKIEKGWDVVYEQDFKAIMSEWNLTPVKKRVIVTSYSYELHCSPYTKASPAQ